MPDSYWCNDLEETIEFISYVLLFAPHEFPEDESMDLDRAFSELRHGFDAAAAQVGEERLAPARLLLEEAYASYTSGQIKEGAAKIQQIEQWLMKTAGGGGAAGAESAKPRNPSE